MKWSKFGRRRRKVAFKTELKIFLGFFCLIVLVGLSISLGRYSLFLIGAIVIGFIIKIISTPSSNYRATAERVLKRKLHSYEIVHHINGNRKDNRIDNLCVMDSVKHEMFHTWLRWKKEKTGKYPSPGNQRKILKEEYEGILLEEVEDEVQVSEVNTQKDTTDLLYEELRQYRNNLARSKNIPPYLIFSNETLMEMAENKPVTDETMLEIKGVGKAKLQDYAASFIEIIKKYTN